MWHSSCYSCYIPGHKLYSLIFSIFTFFAGNILCIPFDWMDTFRFNMSMHIVIAKFGLHDQYYLGNVLLKVYLFVILFIFVRILRVQYIFRPAISFK